MLGKRFREYFTFTKKERNGIVVLLFALVTLIAVRIYLENKTSGRIVLMDDEFRKEIEVFEKGLIPEQTEKEPAVQERAYVKKKNTSQWFIPNVLFQFNPNNATRAELKQLGFSDYQANNLISYRENGGKFFAKTDLLKIYGIKEKQYEVLAKYILLGDEVAKEISTKENKHEIFIELNTASKIELEKLKGIGTVYAERIVKYRKLLGGYYNNKQLLEVYGIDSSRYLSFCENIYADTSLVMKINLNKANYDSLISHPYINKYQAKSILKFKSLMGNFSQLEQIYENNLLTKEEYLKIKPYLELK